LAGSWFPDEAELPDAAELPDEPDEAEVPEEYPVDRPLPEAQELPEPTVCPGSRTTPEDDVPGVDVDSEGAWGRGAAVLFGVAGAVGFEITGALGCGTGALGFGTGADTDVVEPSRPVVVGSRRGNVGTVSVVGGFGTRPASASWRPASSPRAATTANTATGFTSPQLRCGRFGCGPGQRA